MPRSCECRPKLNRRRTERLANATQTANLAAAKPSATGGVAAVARKRCRTRIRFLFVLHDHQPIGNFDNVFEQAYQDSYRPFLDVFERYPRLKMALHTSGPLMEWLDVHHPEYLDRLARLVAAGRIEIIGGPFYEPILSMIPSRDRVGQIRLLSPLAGGSAAGAGFAACGCPNASGNRA